MAYRVHVNGKQLLGNNEFPIEVKNELIRQGCKMDQDDIFNKFELKDLNSFILALETYMKRTDKEIKRNFGTGIADLSEEFILYQEQGNLTAHLYNLVEAGYLFVTYNLLNYTKGYWEMKLENGQIVYKIKEGRHIYISGY